MSFIACLVVVAVEVICVAGNGELAFLGVFYCHLFDIFDVIWRIGAYEDRGWIGECDGICDESEHFVVFQGVQAVITFGGEFFFQPHATASPDGKVVVWESDMNDNARKADAFMALVPIS